MKDEIPLDAFFKKSVATEKLSTQTVETLPKLPQGWRWELLKEVGKVVNGFGFPLKFQGKTGLPYGFVKVSDMNLPGNDVYITQTINTVDKKTLKQIGARVYPPGTIIFPKIGGAVATNKKRILAIEASFDNNIMGIIPRENVHPKWLYFFLCTIDLMTLTKTTTMPSIRKTKVEKIKVPVPSLDVQRRVVARIEELMSRIEQAKKLREEALKDTEKIMQAALHQTFKNPEQKGWKWVILEDVSIINKEMRDPRKTSPTDYFIYIDISSVESGTGNILAVKKILGKDAPSRARRVVHYNDVLMSTVRPYLKSFATVPIEYDNQICSTGFAVLTPKEEILPRFLLYCLFSDTVIEQCNSMMVGAHYPALNQKQISKIRIPLPSIDEQKIIVEYLDEISKKIHKLKKWQQETENKLEIMAQAVLRKAFSGEL